MVLMVMQFIINLENRSWSFCQIVSLFFGGYREDVLVVMIHESFLEHHGMRC